MAVRRRFIVALLATILVGLFIIKIGLDVYYAEEFCPATAQAKLGMAGLDLIPATSFDKAHSWDGIIQKGDKIYRGVHEEILCNKDHGVYDFPLY